MAESRPPYARGMLIGDFQPGATIRHAHGSDGYIVVSNYGSYAIAVRAVTIYNPREWLIFRKDDSDD